MTNTKKQQTQQGKNSTVIWIFFFFIAGILIVGMFAFSGMLPTKADDGGIELDPTTTPTPHPTNNPNDDDPTDSPTANPTQNSNDATAKVWQTLFVKTDLHPDGYWILPPKLYNALSITAVGPSNEVETVSSVQNAVYMKVNSLKDVTSWELSFSETIKITNVNTEETTTLVSDVPITKTGQSIGFNTNNFVTGATLTASDFESVVKNAVCTDGTFYYIINLDNIILTLNYDDGTSETLVQQKATSENNMQWLIGVNSQLAPAATATPAPTTTVAPTAQPTAPPVETEDWFNPYQWVNYAWHSVFGW